MPNRKVNSGWYRLPLSGGLYYGPLPEDVDPLSDAELRKIRGGEDPPKTKTRTSGRPAATEAEDTGSAPS